MPARHHPKGRPVHDAEARGIHRLVSGLPPSFTVYSNIELPTGIRGQTYEHDAVVVAPHGVFSVELKSWGGTITGNRDRWTLADGTFVQSPLPLVLSKARSLKGRLLAMRRDFTDVWVQGLVFLSAGDAVPHITPEFAPLVCTTTDILEALTDPKAFSSGRLLLPGQLTAIHQFLNDGRPTRAPEQINGFHLIQRLASEDRPYDAWLAKRDGTTRVLHVHTVTGDDAAERDRSRTHALREATLHEKLRGGPDVLGYRDYFQTDGDPQRIVLVFDDTTPLVPSDAWVRDRAPGLVARLTLASRIARALSWVHGRGLVHRRFSPEAVLVSGPSSDRAEEVRLAGFDLARDLGAVSPTVTGTTTGDPSFRCIAPETLRTGESTVRSDLFSLGATLFELFAGRPLFATPDAVLRPFTLPPLEVAGRQVPPEVLDTLRDLLAPDPVVRCASAEVAADTIDAAIARLTHVPKRRELRPGDTIRDVYELERRLGRGATATTWLAQNVQSGARVVLKIAGAAHAPLLQEEHRIGVTVHHANLVRVHNVEPFEDGNLLVLGYVEGVTATLWAAAGDPLDPAKFKKTAEGLLGALGALHEAGWLHRDVKPDNVMLAEPSARPTLVDLGLACPLGREGGLAVGTVQYKDPLVYSEGRWTPANDQYAAFIVLYELLTGSHPFGSAAPDLGQPPVVEADQFPDSFPRATADRLAAVFRRALAPTREERPASIEAAVADLDEALGTAKAAKPAPEPTVTLPDTATPDAPIHLVAVSTRGQGALARLGILTVAGLASLTPERLQRLPNVGAKTARELMELCRLVLARWPDLSTAAPAALERFFSALVTDERALADVDAGLTPSLRQSLADRGIRTVGDLARLPALSVAALPHFTPERQAVVRKHLARLAGREAAFESLDTFDAALREEIGERSYAALAGVIGLQDGVVRSYGDTGEQMGVSRQRVAQLIELDALRQEGNIAQVLARMADDLLPPAGIARLEDLAGALALRLPVRDATRVNQLGYARLGALLLRPEASVADAASVRFAVRPPWDDRLLDEALGVLGGVADWPPVSHAAAATAVWDGTGEELQRSLIRWGADSSALLEALLSLGGDVCVDRHGGLYTPPVRLVDALRALRPLAGPRESAAAWIEEARRVWEGVEPADDLDRAFRDAGFRLDDGMWVDPARVEARAPTVEVRLDDNIPRQRAGPEAAVLRSLVASSERGGVRVVAMPPGHAHRLGRQLAEWLAADLGEARVRFVDLDRALIQGLKQADLWVFVPGFEATPNADWSWLREAAVSALDAAVADAAPGTVTILARPALLGTLGLMDWLTGFYERARGGRFGLIVLAAPGGIHEERVRLNERHNLPCTPDMAPVFLEVPPSTFGAGAPS